MERGEGVGAASVIDIHGARGEDKVEDGGAAVHGGDHERRSRLQGRPIPPTAVPGERGVEIEASLKLPTEVGEIVGGRKIEKGVFVHCERERGFSDM